MLDLWCISKNGDFLGRNKNMSFVVEKFKPFWNFYIKMGFQKLTCGAIKEKIDLDSRERFRACQLWGQRFSCQNITRIIL